MGADLLALLALYARLSLLAIGGANTVVPEMQRVVVDVHHWMSGADFAAAFALAQAAPGPNLMVSTLVGMRVAGLPGALVATLAMITPSSLLTIVTVGLWHRFRDTNWRRVVQAGIVPVTIGLWSASGAVIASATDTSVALIAITAVVAAMNLFTRVHPLWLLGAGALLGVLGAG